jgi:hypothetical protein
MFPESTQDHKPILVFASRASVVSGRVIFNVISPIKRNLCYNEKIAPENLGFPCRMAGIRAYYIRIDASAFMTFLPTDRLLITLGETSMTDMPPNDESLRQEFEALGKNLIDALRSAWEAPESKRLRDEMTTGLNDLGSNLKREAENLANHPATQQMKNDVEHMGEKIRAPEAQARVRSELIGALQTVNAELQKVIDRWKAAENTGEQTAQEPPTPQEPPSNSPAEKNA